MKNEIASSNLFFGPPLIEFLSLELETRHEVFDDLDLGIRKNRFVERDGLGNVVVEPEEGRDRGHDGAPCGLA